MEGKYQSNIPDLPNLEDYRYENIFKVYQTGDKNFYFYNINKKIEIPSDLDESFFDYVNLNSKIPLTTLSYQLYGTTYLWWLLMVINKINNPVKNLQPGKIRFLRSQFLQSVLDNLKNQLQ